MLVLDDLHAADEGTLQLFGYLARQAGQLPLLLIGAWRTEDPGAATLALETLVGALARHVPVHQLALEPLSASEHEVLLVETLGGGGVDPGMAEDVYRLTEGNPLFASEMVRELAGAGRLRQQAGVWRYAPIDDAGHLRSVIPPSCRRCCDSGWRCCRSPHAGCWTSPP